MSLLNENFDITKNDIVSIIIKYFLNNYYTPRLANFRFEIDEHLYYYAGNKIFTQIEYDGNPENWELRFTMSGGVAIFKLIKFGGNWGQCGEYLINPIADYDGVFLSNINLKMLFNIFNHEPIKLYG